MLKDPTMTPVELPETDAVERRLARSKFRARFKLDPSDLAYLERAGMEAIASHARDFVRQRIAPAAPKNDGKQTPFRGHPAFKAQHATATCCRSCIRNWYGFPKGVALSEEQCEWIVERILRWIRRQQSQPVEAPAE